MSPSRLHDMVAIRLRHPRGVTTLDVDPDSQTIDHLRGLVFSATEIPPASQELKFGYPPKPLPIIDGLLATIPITKGEQIIVTEVASTAPRSLVAPTSTTTPAPSVKPLNDALSAPTPPSSIPRPQTPLHEQDIPIETSDSVALPGRDAGYLQLRVVPDDNSCLFSALGVVFEGGVEGAKELRHVAAKAIQNDPVSYSDVILGMPRDQYVQKIVNPNTWGGAIELSIFAKHYRTEISSFDVATGRCDRFGQDEYDSRCLLAYSGIHYDAITLSPMPISPPSFHTSVFPISDTTIIPTAEKLVNALRARHYYTDTGTFDLRCGVCQVGLVGEKGAREHAMQTGHVEFGEY